MVVRTAYFLGIKCNQGTSAKAKYSGRGKKGKITCDLLTLLPLITGAPDGYIFHEWCEHLRKLAVFWLKLGACTSWSKELYLITHRWQAADAIRPQLSSVLMLKMIFRKVTATWEDRHGVGEGTHCTTEHLGCIRAHLRQICLLSTWEQYLWAQLCGTSQWLLWTTHCSSYPKGL